MKKTRVNSLERPVSLYGKVVFEFFGNDDENFKKRALERLARDLRKEFNVSCIAVEENYLTNPERGTLALSAVASTMERGGNLKDSLLEYLDRHAPARILSESFAAEELE